MNVSSRCEIRQSRSTAHMSPLDNTYILLYVHIHLFKHALGIHNYQSRLDNYQRFTDECLSNPSGDNTSLYPSNTKASLLVLRIMD